MNISLIYCLKNGWEKIGKKMELRMVKEERFSAQGKMQCGWHFMMAHILLAKVARPGHHPWHPLLEMEIEFPGPVGDDLGHGFG